MNEESNSPGFIDRFSNFFNNGDEDLTIKEAKNFVGPRRNKLQTLSSNVGDKLSETAGLFGKFSKTPTAEGIVNGLFEQSQARLNDPLVQSSIATSGFSGSNPLKSFMATGSGRAASVPEHIASARLVDKERKKDAENDNFKKSIIERLLKQKGQEQSAKKPGDLEQNINNTFS